MPECQEYEISLLIIGKGMNQLAFSKSAGGNIDWYNCSGKLLDNIYQTWTYAYLTNYKSHCWVYRGGQEWVYSCIMILFWVNKAIVIFITCTSFFHTNNCKPTFANTYISERNLHTCSPNDTQRNTAVFVVSKN